MLDTTLGADQYIVEFGQAKYAFNQLRFATHNKRRKHAKSSGKEKNDDFYPLLPRTDLFQGNPDIGANTAGNVSP